MEVCDTYGVNFAAMERCSIDGCSDDMDLDIHIPILVKDIFESAQACVYSFF